MKWPKGPPHLALNPPYCFVFLCVFGLSRREKQLLPLKKEHFCLFFNVSLFSSLSVSSFSFCFLSLLSFFFLLCFCHFSLAVFLCFSFLERTSSNYYMSKVFLPILVFSSTIKFLSFKKATYKTPILSEFGGLQHDGFLNNLC